MPKPQPKPYPQPTVADPTSKNLFLELELPDQVFKAYRDLAEQRGTTLPRIIVEALIQNSAQAGRTAFFTTQDERREIDNLAGRNVLNAGELLTVMRRMSSLQLDDIACPIEPTLLARLKSRQPGGQTFAEFVRDTVKQQLLQFVGLG